MTVNHGQPAQHPLSSTLIATDAVMRGRATARPYLHSRVIQDRTLPPPGAVWYMDFTGTMTPSHPHRYTVYAGLVDLGSSYGRAFPDHFSSAAVARKAYETFAADLTALMGLTHPIKPQLVISDQGSAYMAHHFREFLTSGHVNHRPAVTYTATQNAPIERKWGTWFATARILLASARLPPTFHPFAVQTAVWLWNRLPLPSRGNISAFFALTRQMADLLYLRAFGCLAYATIPVAARKGDRHFTDRGVACLYMGPSESVSGMVIYLPSTKTVTTTTNAICYEDRCPGVSPPFDWMGVFTQTHTPHTELDTNVATNVNAPTVNAQPHLLSPALITPPADTAAAAAPPPADDPDPAVTANANARPVDGVLAPQPPPLRRSSRTFTQAPQHNISLNDQQSQRYRDMPVRTTGHGLTACMLRLLACSAIISPALAYQADIDDVSTGVERGHVAHAFAVTHTAEMGDVTIPRGYGAAMRSQHAPYWREAIAKELRGLIENATWTTVQARSLPSHVNVMMCHFVFALKRLKDGTIDKFKARLVANGASQIYGIDFTRIFSTVVKAATVRVFLAVVTALDYDLTSVDIRQAYLQAELHEDLYMQMPPGLPNTDAHGNRLVLKLRKTLYGLKQAGREWNILIVQFFVSYGFVQSKVDTCLFQLIQESLVLIVLLYVDDIMIASNDKAFRAAFVSALADKFPTDDKGACDWIIGLKITRDRPTRTLVLSQELYVSDLLKRHAASLEHCRRYTSPMDHKAHLTPDMSPPLGSQEYVDFHAQRAEYMSIVGGILWLANMTMPELSYAASQLSRYVSNPGPQHYSACIRVLCYLQSAAPARLFFKPNTDAPLVVYVDSNWATKFSSSGGMFFFMGCLIGWFSKVQRSVSFSSTEAELFGTILAAREAIWFRLLLEVFGYVQTAPTTIYSDNKSCIELSYDPVAFKKTKHIVLAADGLRDYVARLVIRIAYIPGPINVADMLTKPLSPADFTRILNLLATMVGSNAPQSPPPSAPVLALRAADAHTP
jgi:transposase InsO family protein